MECAWHTNGFLKEAGSELLRHLVVLEDAQISQEEPPACPMAVVKAVVMATPRVIETIRRETVSFYHRNNISAFPASCRKAPSAENVQCGCCV